MIDIDRTARRYTGIGLLIIILLWMVSIMVSSLHPEWRLMNAIWVSTTFSIASVLIYIILWRWVIRKHPDSITAFYSVVSSGRMLLALFTLFGCFLVVGRDAMLPYVLVFMIFYFIIIGFHTFYFARFTNKQ